MYNYYNYDRPREIRKTGLEQPHQQAVQEQQTTHSFAQRHRRSTPPSTQHALPNNAYLVPRITKNKLKPIEPDKRLRSKIFSNYDLSLEMEKTEAKAYYEATARSPALSKVRSKIYSIIDDSHQLE